MNNAFPVDDGNFKRGAFKPIAIIVGLAIIAAAAVFLLPQRPQRGAVDDEGGGQ
jgi:hypothetical protein